MAKSEWRNPQQATRFRKRRRFFQRGAPTVDACVTGKLAYGSSHDAYAALATLNISKRRRQPGQAAKRETRVYRCVECKRWHLTSQPTRQQRARRSGRATPWESWEAELEMES